MTNYVGNAFSAGMIDDASAAIELHQMSLSQAKDWLKKDFVSVVGHKDTAELLSAMTGAEIAANRVGLSLQLGDTLLVAQYSGPRLPEGATSLPEGAAIRWILVRRTV